MKTLEQLLRDRLNDHRAMTGVLNINIDRVYIDFGQIGSIPKIRMKVKGNTASVVFPELAKDGEGHTGDEAIQTELEGDKLVAGKSGPEVALPAGYVLVSEADLAAIMDKAEAAGDAPDETNGTDGDGEAGETPPNNDGSGENVEPVDHQKHSKDDLIAMAENTPGVEFNKSDNKAEIAAAINKARGL